MFADARWDVAWRISTVFRVFQEDGCDGSTGMCECDVVT